MIIETFQCILYLYKGISKSSPYAGDKFSLNPIFTGIPVTRPSRSSLRTQHEWLHRVRSTGRAHVRIGYTHFNQASTLTHHTHCNWGGSVAHRWTYSRLYALQGHCTHRMFYNPVTTCVRYNSLECSSFILSSQDDSE